MSTILIGTTSWTDKTLVESGLFYPGAAKTSEARLRYYATRFPIVEVDSSYYGMPSEHNSMLWVARTPEAFVFDIKAFRLFTGHQTSPVTLPADIRKALGNTDNKNIHYRDVPQDAREELWRRFRLSLDPLRRAGKLGVVVFQFPPWFVFRRTNLAHILECAEKLSGFPIAVEFRNKTWLEERHRDELFAFERENALAHVVVDEPQGFGSSIPAVWEVTSAEVAAVRLHGRNRETWAKKGLTAAERFNYLYGEPELQEFVTPIKALSSRAARVHVLFNNCYLNYAQRNAADLRRLID
ncbi:MAG: DUF72 domain-containing protein [Gammaproteobacteria bacterium]